MVYTHFIGDRYPNSFDEVRKDHLCTKIFILLPWKEIFTSDQGRYENFEQAKHIDVHLVETYEKYGYKLIEVPKDTVDNRILFILEPI